MTAAAVLELQLPEWPYGNEVMFDGRVITPPLACCVTPYATLIAFSIASTWQRERSNDFQRLMFGISIPLLSAWVILRRTLCTVAPRCCRHQFHTSGVVISSIAVCTVLLA